MQFTEQKRVSRVTWIFTTAWLIVPISFYLSAFVVRYALLEIFTLRFYKIYFILCVLTQVISIHIVIT